MQYDLAWERCRQLQAEDVVVKGKVVGANKGGVVAVVEGLRGGGVGSGFLLILAGYLSLKAFEKRRNSYFALILETVLLQLAIPWLQVDMVTPMCSQLTYEGLLDEIIYILFDIKYLDLAAEHLVLRIKATDALLLLGKVAAYALTLTAKLQMPCYFLASKATDALLLLGKVAAYALTLTSFFYCQVSPSLETDFSTESSSSEEVDNGELSPKNHYDVNNNGDANKFEYAYGLATLGHQLHALGVIDNPKIDLNDPLAEDLMSFYERMGDTLAHQYGGSAAHNKYLIWYLISPCAQFAYIFLNCDVEQIFLRGGGNGKRQLSLRNSSKLFNFSSMVGSGAPVPLKLNNLPLKVPH
ncbi:hypothetical protein G4B88_005133 [Cannabis sativa]|uniref:SAC domain-containing protein n=1 Tax=Cannabis sativa TaxID=3483 RepID=A0A7J6ESE2_CANSA|nr:hypothetical protein G4B88_005133 [Cannabis sativa]